MPGPAPKHHSVRARRNKTGSSRAVLTEPEPDEVEIPELPPMRLAEERYTDEDGKRQARMVEVPWRLETREWWEDIFSSPMAGEFHLSDRHGLLRLACLIDEFWMRPTVALSGEIRLTQKDYGLTPLDRRRLEWTIASAEKATDEGQKRNAPVRDDDGPDPRLHIV
jgi:hypothetical protein